MKIRADRTIAAFVDTRAEAWVPSPEPGVERIRLEREGGEVAIATSLVRYAPGSSFQAHWHEMGEEFLVLEGVFEDEHGAYPQGSYVRNPWGTRHTPRSAQGCVIFVKLRQMAQDDRLRVFERDVFLDPPPASTPRERRLHRTVHEEVSCGFLPAGSVVPDSPQPPHRELLILDGTLESPHGLHGPGSWLRLPLGTSWVLQAKGAVRYWIKRGAPSWAGAARGNDQ